MIFVRNSEISLGVIAGCAGLILSGLSMLNLLPYRPAFGGEPSLVVGAVLAGANIIGILGALIVGKNHILGAAIMTVVTIAVIVFGFPWQSLPAVIYIMSVVMAAVPVKPAQ